MSVLLDELKSLRAAVSFMTVLPVIGNEKFDSRVFANAIRYFTFTGFFFGFLNLVLLFLFKNFFFDKHLLFSFLLVFFNLFLCAGLHLDGLMDSFDGVAASKPTRQETLRVIKDSNVGAFGSMAASLALLAKFTFLAELDYSKNFMLIAFLLFLMPILSRFMVVIVMCFQVKAAEAQQEGCSLAMFKLNDNSLVTVLVNVITAKIFAWIFILVFKVHFSDILICDLIIVPWMIVTWFSYLWLKRKLKGHNGDSMGAGIELSEVLYLFALTMLK